MKPIIKNTAILLIITLVAAVVLSSVYQLTKEPIAAAEQAAKEAAYKAVYSDAATFDEVENAAALLEEFNSPRTDGSSVLEVLQATDANGAKLGYVLTANSKKGYGGDVKIALGIDTTGTVIGYSVLDCSGETAGFGARAADPDIAEQFPGITDAEQLDGISGATHTTEALKTETQAAIDLVKQLEGGEG